MRVKALQHTNKRRDYNSIRSTYERKLRKPADLMIQGVAYPTLQDIQAKEEMTAALQAYDRAKWSGAKKLVGIVLALEAILTTVFYNFGVF
jgi:hypothetical protein